LLILAGKVVLANGAADAIEGGERLACGVQRLALPTPEALRSPDRLDFMPLVPRLRSVSVKRNLASPKTIPSIPQPLLCRPAI
jgi:hypothetical protein